MTLINYSDLPLSPPQSTPSPTISPFLHASTSPYPQFPLFISPLNLPSTTTITTTTTITIHYHPPPIDNHRHTTNTLYPPYPLTLLHLPSPHTQPSLTVTLSPRNYYKFPTNLTLVITVKAIVQPLPICFLGFSSLVCATRRSEVVRP